MDDHALVASPLAEVDPDLAGLIGRELERQRTTLDLVASESVPARAVLEAQGSVLTAKYADGYPGHREYDTCDVVDEIEALAIRRACELFGAEHANVQPYSGANANQAVLHALCDPGDAVLGFDFAHGGHPTHGAPETFAGRYYRAAAYGVGESDRLVDMDQVERLAREHRPKLVLAGWSCYTRALDFARFRQICDEVGARLVVDMAHFSGLVAARLYPDPLPYADVCTMTVHKTLAGARGGAILCRAELADRIDDAVYPGEQGCPLPHVIAGKAATFLLASTPAYRERMARTVEGARTVAARLVEAEGDAGISVVTGGTDVHQLLVDVGPGGREAWDVLRRLNSGGISANAIGLAYDRQAPPGVSGLRFGTVAPAGRGMGRAEFAEIGEILAVALADAAGERTVEVRRRVTELLGGFPLFDWIG